MKENGTWLGDFDASLADASFRSSRYGALSSSHSFSANPPDNKNNKSSSPHLPPQSSSFSSVQSSLVASSQSISKSTASLPRPVAFDIAVKKSDGAKSVGGLFGGGASSRIVEAKFLKSRQPEWDKRRLEKEKKVMAMREAADSEKRSSVVGFEGVPLQRRLRTKDRATRKAAQEARDRSSPGAAQEPAPMSDMVGGRVSGSVKTRKRDCGNGGIPGDRSKAAVRPTRGHRGHRVTALGVLPLPSSASFSAIPARARREKEEARAEIAASEKIQQLREAGRVEEMVRRQKRVAESARKTAAENGARLRAEAAKVEKADEELRRRSEKEDGEVRRRVGEEVKKKKERAAESGRWGREAAARAAGEGGEKKSKGWEKNETKEGRRARGRAEEDVPPPPAPVTASALYGTTSPTSPTSPPSPPPPPPPSPPPPPRKADFDELRRFKNPPAAVRSVAAAVCVIFGRESAGWPSAQSLFAKSNFFKSFAAFDFDASRTDRSRLERCMEGKPFDLEAVGRTSKAARAVAAWCNSVRESGREKQPLKAAPLGKKLGGTSLGATALDVAGKKFEIVVGPTEKGGKNFPINKVAFLSGVLEKAGGRVKVTSSTVASKRSVLVVKEGTPVWKGDIDGLRKVEDVRKVAAKVGRAEISPFARSPFARSPFARSPFARSPFARSPARSPARSAEKKKRKTKVAATKVKKDDARVAGGEGHEGVEEVEEEEEGEKEEEEEGEEEEEQSAVAAEKSSISGGTRMASRQTEKEEAEKIEEDGGGGTENEVADSRKKGEEREEVQGEGGDEEVQDVEQEEKQNTVTETTSIGGGSGGGGGEATEAAAQNGFASCQSEKEEPEKAEGGGGGTEKNDADSKEEGGEQEKEGGEEGEEENSTSNAMEE